MCGEKQQGGIDFDRDMGSPPRVRGKVVACVCPVNWCRITPACAGKSAGRWSVRSGLRDHPRVCGEKRHRSLLTRSTLGSPPRVRGKVQQVFHKFFNTGITPACAGKRAVVTARSSAVWDHPRVCGEKYAIQRHPPCGFGITPACAGKRDAPTGGNAVKGDHPRVCGEKQLPSTVHFLSGDHPRVCGEKGTRAERGPGILGSPPRVRGKGNETDKATEEAGITPACAGKRTGEATDEETCGDHPRVCGEKDGQPLKRNK